MLLLSPRSWLTWFVWCIPVVLICLAWQMRDAIRVDIGSSDDPSVVQGFHRREQGITDTFQPYTYRWSEPEARLIFPARPLPGVLELRGSVPPDGTQITLSPGTRLHVDLPTSHGVEAVRRYQLLWPDESDGLGWVQVGIHAWRPEKQVERRSLGMLVAGATLASVQDISLRFPPLLLLVILASFPPLLNLFLRRCGLKAMPSMTLALLIGSVGIVLWGWQPWWIQPFVLNCLFALLSLTGMVWWMQQVVAMSAPTVRIPPSASFLLLLVVCSGLIPLYLLIKYGFNPALSQSQLIALWLHPLNLPVVAMVAGLALPWSSGRFRRVLLSVIVASLLIYGVERYAGAIGKDYATDFTAMFRGVRSFVQGGALYNLEHIRTNHLGDTYKYPPFFVFLMAPIVGLRYEGAILVWHLVNATLLIVAGWLLWRWSGLPLRSWSTLGLLCMLLTFKPVVDTLGNGQADILILASLAAALLTLKHAQWEWWGVLLTFPAAIKLYPAYLLVHGVALRRWRSLVAYGGAFALLYLISVVVLGRDVHTTFVYEVMPAIGGGTAWVENQTINGFLNRLTASQITLAPDEPGLVRWLTALSAILLSGWTLLRVQHLEPDAGFGLWIVTMLVILPIAWMHYQAILLIPFYQVLVRIELWGQSAAGTQPGNHLSDYWRSLLLYTLAWMLLCYGNQWTFFDRTMHGPVWALLLSYKLYGLLLLWFALAYDPIATQSCIREWAVRAGSTPPDRFAQRA